MKKKPIKPSRSGICFLIPIVFSLAAMWNMAGQQPQTNRAFRTTSLIGERFEPKSLKEAREFYDNTLVRETLPAEEYPEGNWGPVTNGLRMSIRFYQTTFTNGEPIHAIILWRNVGADPGYFSSASWENYPFELYLSHEGNKIKPLMPRLNQDPASFDGSAGGSTVEPGTQWRFNLRLDKIFDLNHPGTYELKAKRGDFSVKDKRNVMVQSGTARFQIQPKPTDSTETKSESRVEH